MGESGIDDRVLQTLSATNAADRPRGAPALESRLVLVFQADRPLASSRCYGLTGIHTIRVGRGQARTAERADGVLTVQVPDRRMSSRHAEFQLLIDQWRLRDCDSRNGSFIDGRRISAYELRDGDFIELGHSIFCLQRDCPRPHTDLATAPDTLGLHTLHAGLQRELLSVAKLADTAVTFLIQGESGTGKEVMARALHTLSGRTGPFIGVNAAAIPDALVESELFGHKKGAFSGAVADRPGLIRSAHGGTLFLDEIADLPLAAQAVLLRVLQEREVRPVGETRAIPVDIRLVSATHKDLAERVQRDLFRQDLYARIAGRQVLLPPLRQRRVDLGILIAALLPEVAEHAAGLEFAMDAVRALFRHDWPMNIRELENCLLTSTALTDSNRIERDHLPTGITDGDRGPAAPSPADPAPPRAVRKKPASRADILAALDECDHNIARTARTLGLSRQALYRRMDRFKISRPSRNDDT